MAKSKKRSNNGNRNGGRANSVPAPVAPVAQPAAPVANSAPAVAQPAPAPAAVSNPVVQNPVPNPVPVAQSPGDLGVEELLRMREVINAMLEERDRVCAEQQAVTPAVSANQSASTAPAPVVQVAPADSAAQPAAAETNSEEPTPVVEIPEEDDPVKAGLVPRHAYRYWMFKTRTYGLTSDIWVAKRISGGSYDIVWAWYNAEGQIVRLLDNDELTNYAP